MEKLIEKIKVNCPICNKEHFVEKRKRTNKIRRNIFTMSTNK